MMNTYHTLLASGLSLLLVSVVAYIVAYHTVDERPSNVWFSVFVVSFAVSLVLLFAAGNILHS